MKHRLCILFTLLLFFAHSTTICGAQYDDDTDATLAPYFLIDGMDTATDSFPLKETNVSVNINGIFAETFVTQTYSNEGQEPINATYVFPASSRVTIHGMKMEIGDEIITAKIKEKEEARHDYEQAKSEGKSASLLEQQRPNVFTMDVANVMPGDIIRIELHYTEMITPTDGIYQFVFPTVAGPRYTSPSVPKSLKAETWIASPFLRLGDTPRENTTLMSIFPQAYPLRICSAAPTKLMWHGTIRPPPGSPSPIRKNLPGTGILFWIISSQARK